MRHVFKTIGIVLVLGCLVTTGLNPGRAQTTITIAQARTTADGTTVTVQGVVNSSPGVFDSQLKRFYIQDDSGGLAIYFNDGGLPALVEGDNVTISGIMATFKTERELLPGALTDVVKTGQGDAPQPLAIKSGELGDKQQGKLVTFSGKVTDLKNGFSLDDGSGVAHVFVYKSTGITQTPAIGQTATVIAVAAVYSGAFEVLPRKVSDVQFSGQVSPTSTPSDTQRERGPKPAAYNLDNDPQDSSIEIGAVYAATDEMTSNEQGEAVQLFNSSDRAHDLTGWTLADNVHSVKLDGLVLTPHQTIWVAKDVSRFQLEFDKLPAAEFGGRCSTMMPCLNGSPLTLDNQGGDVYLRSPTGVVDVLVYGDGYSVPGWTGPAVQPYRFADYVPATQVYYRKLDLATCLPVANNSHQASDWAQDSTDPNGGRRLLFPGWSTQFCDTAKGTDNATTTFLVAPDNSLAGLLAELDKATTEIDLELYFLTSPTIVDHITAAQDRGIRVRALFDGDLKPGDNKIVLPGGAADAYLQTYWAAQEISAHGGQVNFWAANTTEQPPIPHRYNDDHQKFVIIDGKTSVISSENFAQTAFPAISGRTTAGNRGAVVITDSQVVAARLKVIFETDDDPTRADIRPWKTVSNHFDRPVDSTLGNSYTLIQPQPLTITGNTAFELVNAPDNAVNTQDALIGMVAKAGKGDRLLVEQQYEYLDWGSPTNYQNPRLQAYIEAARRGANVQIILDGVNSAGTNQPTRAALKRIAATESLDLDVRITPKTGVSGTSFHIKMVILTSGPDGFVHIGSINGSENSSRYNREVAVQVESRAGFDYYAKVFDADWQVAR